ncbi:MAG TPA: glycosyltransferase family 2 protein [Chthonomonadaceae bacterium]|nr:glycosyltransferase family 2 protein [Chthonomonadaceae bacterium]
MEARRPDVTVSIVNTNNCALLEKCLESLFEQTSPALSMEVYLVDNVSTDGSREMVRARFPAVRLIGNERREGFGANHNKVLRVGRGRYFLVLNEDTVILDRAIEKLVAFADRHPEAGIVGPKTFNPDGTLQDTCVRFPTLLRQLRHILFQRYADYCVLSYPPAIHDTAADVEWLRGSCLLVRREALEQVGLLDERFFIFYEEVDWCYRMRQAGWRNLLCPEAHIIHIGKQTVQRGGTGGIAMAAQMTLSEYLYFDKHYPRVAGPAWRLLMLLYLPLRLLKTYLPLARRTPEEQRWQRRVLRHLFWLTTRPPRQLIEIGKAPGGVLRV